MAGVIHSDSHLEFWGEIFTRTTLFQRGVTFERFVRRPDLFVSDDVVNAVLRGERLVEPLRHRAYSLSRHRRDARRCASR